MKFLKSQLISQEKKSIFFPEIRKVRRKEIETRKGTHSWGAPDFKIYPSGLSFGMCPARYVESLAKWSGIEDMGAIYRVKRGSAVHGELQSDFLLSEKIYAKPNNITNKRILDKLESNWPEVPFHDTEETGISGSADSVINWQGPVPVEIKSTSIDPKKWKKHREENLPSLQHVCQIGIYMWMFNRLNYYPERVTRGILAYLNLMFEPGNLESEHEFVVELDKPVKGYVETLNELVEDLVLNGIVPCRAQLMAGEEVKCTYSKCKTHNGRKNKESNSETTE